MSYPYTITQTPSGRIPAYDTCNYVLSLPVVQL